MQRTLFQSVGQILEDTTKIELPPPTQPAPSHFSPCTAFSLHVYTAYSFTCTLPEVHFELQRYITQINCPPGPDHHVRHFIFSLHGVLPQQPIVCLLHNCSIFPPESWIELRSNVQHHFSDLLFQAQAPSETTVCSTELNALVTPPSHLTSRSSSVRIGI